MKPLNLIFFRFRGIYYRYSSRFCRNKSLSVKSWFRSLPGAVLSRFGEKVPKEPTKGVLELPLETPFPLDPPGPSIVAALPDFSLIHSIIRP
jgi:hypothetical protein